MTRRNYYVEVIQCELGVSQPLRVYIGPAKDSHGIEWNTNPQFLYPYKEEPGKNILLVLGSSVRSSSTQISSRCVGEICKCQVGRSHDTQNSLFTEN